MAVQHVAAPLDGTGRRSITRIAAALTILVGLGVIGLASVPGEAAQVPGGMNRADRAWADRLGAIAASQGADATARERATATYSERLTAQADALTARRLSRQRSMAAYSDRLTGLAEHLAQQGR
jgi:hypothetical protein